MRLLFPSCRLLAYDIDKSRPVTCEEEDALGLLPSVLALDETPCVVESGLLGDILSFANVLLAENL